jgi:phospholipid/cholesterol/gamma-HCH transport system ATP-binding protein
MITITGLIKTIGSQEILRGIDLEIQRGESVVIVGRSGGGKSVLLKHIIGLMKPTSGDVLVEGESVIGLSERKLVSVRKKIGILFQSGALFDSMTVEDNLAFPLREMGERDEKIIRQKITEALDVVNLAGTEGKMPESLSGGMKKRVGLARAIIGRPECILYDEPTTGLDPIASDTINHLIRRLQKRYHVTSIVVTHDMKSAFHVGDQIAYLNEGRIYFKGTPDAFRASPDPLIQDFILGRSEDTSDD